MLEVHGRAHGRLELATIRLEHRRATITKEVSILRIDDDRNAPGPRELNRALDHPRNEDALVVVLEHERISVLDRVSDGAEQSVDVPTVEVSVVLLVEAHDLLGAREDAGLLRSGPTNPHERLDLTPHLRELGAKRSSRGVVANHRDQRARRAGSGDILCDVRG